MDAIAPHIDPAQREQLAAAVHAADNELQVARGAPRHPVTHPSGRVNTTGVAFNVFARLLESEGVRAALYSLLRLTDYRFISIFRFQDGKATSAVHVDRETSA